MGDNRLKGSIPREIEHLDLKMLNLSYNKLTGNIPAELGILISLEQMDLSHNKLEGQIPDILSNMTKLIRVDVSYNNLSGDVPQSWKKFLISYPLSFAGNQKLCTLNTSCTANASKNLSRKNGLKKGILAGIILGVIAVCLLVVCIIIISLCQKGKSRVFFINGSKKLSAAEVLHATENLTNDNIVGKGAHGIVYKVISRSGQELAVKKLELSRKTAGATFERELETAGKLQHRNLINIIGYSAQNGIGYIIYEYMELGNLRDALDGTLALDWETRYNIALGTAHGLAYLHHDIHPQIIHRDIKSSNILLHSNMEPCITDFGIAKLIDKDGLSVSAIVGTYGYMAPEYCYTTKVNEKVDLYAFGMVLLELITGKKPVDPSFSEDVDLGKWVRLVIQQEGSVEEVLDPRIREYKGKEEEEIVTVLRLALLCTNENPRARPSMREIANILAELSRPVATFLNVPTSESNVILAWHE